MESVTLSLIEERLEKLSPERLRVVYDFVSYLAEREQAQGELQPDAGALQTMFASEAVLGHDWNTPEEDAAWAHL
ncbi:MAG: hypothetical protein H0X37_15970 [Herpetosiphonaceae bacterium]|nr:hypothetical protein [Herpetosiphonaceae bacterium]